MFRASNIKKTLKKATITKITKNRKGNFQRLINNKIKHTMG